MCNCCYLQPVRCDYFAFAFSLSQVERFEIECRKKQHQTTYLPIRLLSRSQNVVKPKSTPKSKKLPYSFRNPIENCSKTSIKVISTLPLELLLSLELCEYNFTLDMGPSRSKVCSSTMPGKHDRRKRIYKHALTVYVSRIRQIFYFTFFLR